MLLWICLGGAIGTGARYLLSSWLLKTVGPGWPVGTLAVNVLGSFLVAVVMYAGTEAGALNAGARVVLTAGVMGGFTTYSAFSFDILRYAQAGAWSSASLYMLVTVVGCLLACQLGWASARWLLG